MSRSEFNLPKSARERITREIEDCQKRIVRVLVPTIVAFGLTTVANLGTGGGISKIGVEVTFAGFFAVLFSSSLYIASLSYKIFERAAFLRYFSKEREMGWEKVIKKFRDLHSPSLIGSETTAISWIYITLSGLFAYLFWNKISLIPLIVGTVILLGIAIRMWTIPHSFAEERIDEKIKELEGELSEED